MIIQFTPSLTRVTALLFVGFKIAVPVLPVGAEVKGITLDDADCNCPVPD
jgi:hypothetical protein